MRVTFKKAHPDALLPSYGSALASGLDVISVEDMDIRPNEVKAIDTGLILSFLDPDYEIQVRPRSGNTLKRLFTVSNSPGTIDADYRGQIKVLIHLIGPEKITIKKGDKIAQLVVCPIVRVKVDWDEIVATERGGAGFGSTGG